MRKNKTFTRVLAVALVALAPVACDGGGGGRGAEFFVIGASLDSDRVLPQANAYANDPVRILMSADVLPQSVTPDTVDLFRAGAAGERPEVDVRVDGPWIVFLPRLPKSPGDLAGAGFAPGAVYRIRMPGLGATSTVTSRRGRRQRDAFDAKFRVRDDAAPLRDLGLGAPFVEAVVVDLDGDGAAEGDGLASTPENEEFFGFSRVPFASGVPPGLLRRPTEIAIVFSEPLFESTLLERVRIEDEDGVNVPGLLSYSVRYDPFGPRHRALLTFRPLSPLAPDALHRLVIDEGAVDFATPAFALPGFEAFFRTGSAVPGAEDAIEEEFSDTARLDRTSTALWNVEESGVLAAGVAFGGNGSDGAFVARTSRTVLDTTRNGGLFDFTSFIVPPESTVLFEGPHPALVRVLGDARIQGSVRSDGASGISASTRGAVIAGGPGGAGGGDGGAANPGGSLGVSPCGAAGASPPGVEPAGTCPSCGTPRTGGGCGGARQAERPTGGGGGGHSTEGEGFGGTAYGGETIAALLGGSGGGAGGNLANPDDYRMDFPGASGGGGGGAFGIDVLGTFVLAGRLSASGGSGGRSRSRDSSAGGGGSGGAVRIRATSFEVTGPAAITCLGGPGGAGFSDDADGGSGARGRIRIETIEPPVGLDRALYFPAPSLGTLAVESLGRTFAASTHYDTFAPSPRYAFDAADPRTGELRASSRVRDVAFAGGIPGGTSARIEFFGANEDPLNPGRPDRSTEFGPVTDVTLVDGMRFIRFVIFFEIDPAREDLRPEIDRLRIRFRR